jgi:hypothetical protein
MNSVPKAERAKLMALQHRYLSLLAMLPGDVDELADLDELDVSQIAGWELIAVEMMAVNNAQLAILDGLAMQKGEDYPDD